MDQEVEVCRMRPMASTLWPLRETVQSNHRAILSDRPTYENRPRLSKRVVGDYRLGTLNRTFRRLS